MPALANERLFRARGSVDRVCELLISPTPTQLDQCSGLLAGAVADLTAGRDPSPAPASPHRDQALREARLLSRSIRRAQRLLEGAAAYQAQWVRCLGALCGGYTNRGEPASVASGSRFSTRG